MSWFPGHALTCTGMRRESDLIFFSEAVITFQSTVANPGWQGLTFSLWFCSFCWSEKSGLKLRLQKSVSPSRVWSNLPSSLRRRMTIIHTAVPSDTFYVDPSAGSARICSKALSYRRARFCHLRWSVSVAGLIEAGQRASFSTRAASRLSLSARSWAVPS